MTGCSQRNLWRSGPSATCAIRCRFGAVTLLCGLGLLERSLSLLLFAVLLFLFLHFVVVLVEEPGLEKRFGNTYRSYKQSVNRWLPSYRRKVVERT
jgi:hypothetical protein